MGGRAGDLSGARRGDEETMTEPSGSTALLINLAPFALILVVFYFLLVRPQQERARQVEEMLAGLRVNDEIVTNGGLHGRIVRVQDKVLTVELGPKLLVKLDRAAVAEVRGKTVGQIEEKA